MAVRRRTIQVRWRRPRFANALYGADTLTPGRPVVLVEGEIDALTVRQAAGDLAGAVATGATGGARRAGWVAQLALAPTVLVAFDADPNGAGDQAAAWWLSVLANGRRLRPVGAKDVNAMHTTGIDVRAWVMAGLR
ncbi:MAG: toprim domain-containing protein [Anaerolineales bacterium]|nr:toprim domain-containing protein [Anaerolineales bacterium]